MTSLQRIHRVCGAICLVAAIPATATGQGRRGGGTPPPPLEIAGLADQLQAVRVQDGRGFATDPLTGPVVLDAPFSADATTTVTQTLGDGTRIEQNTTSRFYRDRAGRVRREQTILGLALNGRPMQTITVDPDPGDGFAYSLDPSTRTARRVPQTAAAFGLRTNGAIENSFYIRTAPPPSAGNRTPNEELGTRTIEGVKVLGRKRTTTIPVGQIGNDRPIDVTDERWESPELRMLVYSRNSDPRTGVVEFKLTNISRTEPPQDVFIVPSDYTILEPGAGARGRGARDGGPAAGGR